MTELSAVSAWWEFIASALLGSIVKPIIVYTGNFYYDNWNLNA